MRRFFAPVVLTCVTGGVAYYNLISQSDRLVLMGMETLVGADPQRQGEASLAFLAGLMCIAWVMALRDRRLADDA